MTNADKGRNVKPVYKFNGGTYLPSLLSAIGRYSPRAHLIISPAITRSQRSAKSSPATQNQSHLSLPSVCTTPTSDRATPPNSQVNPSMEGEPVTTPICGLTYGQLTPKPIKCFSGSDDQDFESWLRKFEDVVRMVSPPLPDQLRISTLVGFLEGGARDIIDDLSDTDKNSYAAVIDHLRAHFESPQFRSLARQQLSDCKQGPTESAREFADRIKQIVKKVTRGQPRYAQNERLLDEFQDRLKPALRFHVKAANPLTFDDAVVKATTYESLLNDVASAITIFPGTQPAAPPHVRVVAARNTSAPSGPGQYRQRYPSQQRRKPRTYYTSSNRSRRFWERAPNSDIVCYRCGRRGHFQTFCHYSLPPAGLQPPQLPAPRNGNTTSNATFPRVPHSMNQGYDITSTNPGRSEPRRRSTVLAADTSNEVSNCATTVSDADKDARIAALIERNNALADLVFATQNTTLSDDHDDRSEGKPSTSSKIPAWTYTCLMILALASSAQASSLPPAYLCSNRSPLSYWKVPEQINCTRILPPWSSTPQFLSLKVYRPNTIRYESTAHVCRIISQTVVYSVNFFGARSQRLSTHETAVPVGVCQHMVRHKSCAHGDLLAVGTVWKTLNPVHFEWPSAPFHCCSENTVTVTNCVVFQTKVFAYHGSSTIESPIGPLPGCQYKGGSCTTSAGAAVIWTPDRPSLPLLVVPQALRQLVFNAYHSSALSGGHMGWRKTLAKILRKYYWPSLYTDIHKWCEACLTCQMRRQPNPGFKERLIPVHSEAVFAKVGLDLCGPLKVTERGNRYILNMICWFTRYVISVPLPDARANTIAHALLTECVLKYGTMSELISDQASSFTSHFYQEFCNLLYIQHKLATPYHSMGNGATERTFRTFEAMLSKFINIKQEDWDLFLPCVAFCYNTTINDATGESPYFLLFGRDPVFAIDRILEPQSPAQIPDLNEIADYKAQLISALQLAWSNAAEYAQQYKTKMKSVYDKTARPSKIQIGDRVFFKNYTNKQGLARKLCFPWIGQFRVIKVDPPHATIISITSPQSKPRRVHMNQIKKVFECSGPASSLPTIPEEEEELLLPLPIDPIVGYDHPPRLAHAENTPSTPTTESSHSYNLRPRKPTILT